MMKDRRTDMWLNSWRVGKKTEGGKKEKKKGEKGKKRGQKSGFWDLTM